MLRPLCIDVPLVVMAFSSNARIMGKGSTNHFSTALFFFFKVESARASVPVFRPRVDVEECSLASCV